MFDDEPATIYVKTNHPGARILRVKVFENHVQTEYQCGPAHGQQAIIAFDDNPEMRAIYDSDLDAWEPQILDALANQDDIPDVVLIGVLP